jgi:hypothetical protein
MPSEPVAEDNHDPPAANRRLQSKNSQIYLSLGLSAIARSPLEKVTLPRQKC